MIMMMQGHTLDAVVVPSAMDLYHSPWVIWFHLRGFTAPVFLSVSGMLFALTLKRSSGGVIRAEQAWKRIRWAAILGLIGYLFAMPASNIFHLQYVDRAGWQSFFQLNILQHNALSLTLLTLVAALCRSDKTFGILSFGLSAVFCFASPWLNGVPWFSLVPEFIGSMLSYAHGSYFPLFPFSSYMFFGAGVGSLLRSVPRERQSEALISLSRSLGAVLALCGAVLYFVDPLLSWMPKQDILRSMPSTVFLRESVVLLSIVALSRASEFLSRHRRLIELFGKQSLVIYVVHLIILFGTTWFSSFGRMYFKSLPLSAGLMLAPVVVISTLFVVYADDRLRHHYGNLRRLIHYCLTFLLIYFLLFG